LVREIERAHAEGRYDSPELRGAVREFVTTARHAGVARERVLAALADVLDAGILARLRQGEQALMSERVLSWGREAYGEAMCDACAASERLRSQR